jgi:MoaA/NifB/PqqE/SkfB family radical SAM enzyme
MNLLSLVWRKLRWEADGLAGRISYPFRARGITARLKSTLPSLTIETTNICNADCIFCAYQFQERPTGVMDQGLFRKIIDEYVELGGGRLGLTPTVGDPLVDKHLIERIRYARSRPEITLIGMYSNMISLGRVGADNLARSGINEIVVSISGLEAAQYKRVYRSDMYGQVMANLRAFIAANRAAGNPVDFRLEMRVDRPLGEVTRYPDYLEIAAAIGADKIGVKFRYDDWSGRITPEMLSGGMKIRSHIPARISPCSELFSGPMIYWDGRVGACGCRDINASDLIIGDVRRQHLGEIWFGSEINKLRDEFLSDKIQPICDTCKHYNNMTTWARLSHIERLVSIQPSHWPLPPKDHSAAPSADRSEPIGIQQ